MNVFSLTKKAHFSLWIQCWWVHCRPTSVGVFSVWVAADHRWSNEDIKRRRVVSSPPLPPVKLFLTSSTDVSQPSVLITRQFVRNLYLMERPRSGWPVKVSIRDVFLFLKGPVCKNWPPCWTPNRWGAAHHPRAATSSTKSPSVLLFNKILTYCTFNISLSQPQYSVV